MPATPRSRPESFPTCDHHRSRRVPVDTGAAALAQIKLFSVGTVNPYLEDPLPLAGGPRTGGRNRLHALPERGTQRGRPTTRRHVNGTSTGLGEHLLHRERLGLPEQLDE